MHKIFFIVGFISCAMVVHINNAITFEEDNFDLKEVTQQIANAYNLDEVRKDLKQKIETLGIENISLRGKKEEIKSEIKQIGEEAKIAGFSVKEKTIAGIAAVALLVGSIILWKNLKA